jgi:hypothetical protein
MACLVGVVFLAFASERRKAVASVMVSKAGASSRTSNTQKVKTPARLLALYH